MQDIEDRLRILNNLSASAQKQADEMEAKMIEWQTKLVELSTAKDKASHLPPPLAALPSHGPLFLWGLIAHAPSCATH